MSKKFLYALMASTLCFGVFAVGCKGCSKDEDPATVYEGDMLYNGFDSVADLYRIEQLYTWGFQPVGNKMNIVGKDNFLPAGNNDYQAVIDQINALPALAEVTLEHKAAVAQARRAYGSLSQEGRAKVTNVNKLTELENSDALKGYYTVGDFGGDFASSIAGVGSWNAFSGNLIDNMSGTVIFEASNLTTVDGAIYVSLFHDASKNAGQPGDGIGFYLCADGSVFFYNSSPAQTITSNGIDISSNETYTFCVGYDVAEDYSKITISVAVEDSQGVEIVNGSRDITSFNLNDFGAQTVKSWVEEHEDADEHQTFYINSGASNGFSVADVWTATLPDDYVLGVDPHNADDLAPRQGEGALRIAYESGAFTDILSRFDNSLLAGLPVNEIGSFSVRVYNDSEEEKKVTLSLMKEDNVKLEVDDGEFTLAPYAWTDCKVTLLPAITDQFQDQLIGFNIRFEDVTDAVYYLDDFRVQFGPVHTDETKAWVAAAADLDSQISALIGKTITAADKAQLEALCSAYNQLPPSYRYTVKNAEVLTEAVASYMSVVGKEQIAAEGKETVLYFDSAIGVMQIKDSKFSSTAYTTEDAVPGTSGSMAISFDGTDGASGWPQVSLNPSKKSGFEEVHVWVNNKSDHRRAFYLDWQVAVQAFDAEGNEIPLTKTEGSLYVEHGFALPANSGWIRLVYRTQFPLTQINVGSLADGGLGKVQSSDTLLVGKVEFVYKFGEMEEIIAALPAYYAGYSADDVAKVAAAREAFDKLSIESQLKVSNASKLIGLEANIWKSGFSKISASTPDGLTTYNEQDKAAVEALRSSYEALHIDVRKTLSAEEALLSAFEAKLDQLQINYVESVKAQIAALDGTDVAAVEAARAAYDSLNAANKALVDNANVLFGFEAAIWTATLDELPAVDDVASFDADLANSLYDIRAGYNALADETKPFAVDGEATLSALEAKLAQFGEIVLKPGDIVASGDDWYTIKINPTKTTGYKEAHVKVRNNGASAVAFQVNWKVAKKAYDASGKAIAVDPNGVIEANSDWITLVFTQTDIAWSELIIGYYEGGVVIGDIDVTVESITFHYVETEVNPPVVNPPVVNPPVEDEPDETENAVYDFTSDISQVSAVNNCTSSYSESEQALEINFGDLAASTWARVDLTDAAASNYTEVRLFVKNDTNADIALQINWTAYTSVVSGDASKVTSIWGGTTCIKANSGWLEIAYTVADASQLNIALVSEVTSGSLYIGKIALPVVNPPVEEPPVEEPPVETETVVHDFTSDISKVSSVTVNNEATTNVTTAYSATEQALALEFPGLAAGTWVNVALTSGTTPSFTTAHLFVKNDTNADIVLQMNWNLYSSVASGDASKIGTTWGATCIKANSGWVEIVYTVSAADLNNLNIALVGEVTSGSLYISKITVE